MHQFLLIFQARMHLLGLESPMGPVELTHRNIAVFFDYDNFAINAAGILTLVEQLSARGRLVVKRAYGDWGSLTSVKQTLSCAAFDLIELPIDGRGKNRGDIRLVVDAMEIAMTRNHIDTFVIVSGDSDFLPLIAKLRELNRYVIVVARRDSASKMILNSCDELIYFERPLQQASGSQTKFDEPLDLLRKAIHELTEKGTETGYSEVKAEMLKLDSKFSESRLGFKQFSRFIDSMVAHGVVAKSLSAKGGVRLTLPAADVEHPPTANSLVNANNPQPKSLAKKVVDPGKKVSKAPSAKAPISKTPISKAPSAKASKTTTTLTHGPLPKDLLDQIHWACSYRLRDGEKSLCLARLSGGLRKLYPTFSLAQYGFPKQGGFLKLAQVMEIERWCDIQHGPDPSQYTIRLRQEFLERRVQAEKPEDFDELKRLDNLRYSGNDTRLHNAQVAEASMTSSTENSEDLSDLRDRWMLF